MKYSSNSLNQEDASKTLNFYIDMKERKLFLKNNINKNYKNFNLSLLLQKEREIAKANSTTQTGQKSKIVNPNTNNENYNYSLQRYINENNYEDDIENKKSVSKMNNFYVFGDKLYIKNNINNINGKIILQQTNDLNNNNNSINNRKSYRFNNMSLTDVCYNSIINSNYRMHYPKIRNNNIDMYRYYDPIQRRIEKIIPNLNEYLDNNSIEKNKHQKMTKTYSSGYKPNKERNTYHYAFLPKSLDNKNNNNIKTKKIRILSASKDFDKNKKINLCLYNSINDNSSKKNYNKKIEIRDFSTRNRNRKIKKLWDLERMNLEFKLNKNKISIGIVNYISTPNIKDFNQIFK